TLNPGTGSNDTARTETFAMGETYTLPSGNTFRPKDGYTFRNWKVGNETKQPGDEITVNANTDITAEWNAPVTVTLNPGTGSNDTARTETFAMGSSYTLPQNPFQAKSDRYAFRAWRVGDTERIPGQTITLSSNIEITAEWYELVTVTFNPGTGSDAPEWTLSMDKDSRYILPGNPFQPKDGYTFRNWKVGDEAKNPNDTITVNADTVITAEWNEPIPQVTVIWDPGTGSDAAVWTESRDKDSTFELPGNLFQPRSNLYSFKNWLVNGVAMQPGATITLSANTVIMAEWNEPELYTVTVSNGEGGGQYQQGETVRITAAPTRGESSFTVWTWTGPENFAISDIMSTDTTFTMPAGDVSVTANYGGCYVATAVYGSYDCPEVWTLRRFRDQVLAKTWYGRLFIHLYYAVSPTAVRLFGQSSLFQNFFRSILDPWVANLQSDGFESTPYNDMPW
ncbi:MAG: InlB B-repeat-containing protein, partial [Oscillibacter sp.]|nr:InlB B-repeat-containing protein [Oscillibacter sp.]